VSLVIYENETCSLAGADRAYLQALLGGNFEPRADGFAVSRLVGHVQLPSAQTLFIRSKKASAAALFAWTAYVDPSLRALQFLGSSADSAEEGDFFPWLARVFVHEFLGAARRHGLLRRYRRVHVESGTIRGAIDFAKLARLGAAAARIPCNTWERLPQTPLNQTLAAALRRIERDPATRLACRSDLPAALTALAEVRPVPDPGLLSGRTPLRRNERHFQDLLALARLILETSGFGEGEKTRGPAFLLNLETLFELAVARALADADIGAIPKAPARYAKKLPGQGWTRASMQMDVFIPDLDGQAVVVDAKYKTQVSSGNLQQMVAYCLLSGATNAVLAFPAGFVPSGTRYRFSNQLPGGEDRNIDVITGDLATHGRSLGEWRAAGKEFADFVTSRFHSNLARPAPREPAAT
jgi:5-methylcytosine-specific restriction endonuclease McrBC regulatory subunit McrC